MAVLVVVMVVLVVVLSMVPRSTASLAATHECTIQIFDYECLSTLYIETNDSNHMASSTHDPTRLRDFVLPGGELPSTRTTGTITIKLDLPIRPFVTLSWPRRTAFPWWWSMGLGRGQPWDALGDASGMGTSRGLAGSCRGSCVLESVRGYGPL